MDVETREIFWNVPAWARAVMYVLFVLATGALTWGLWLRFRAWRRGRDVPRLETLRPNWDALLRRAVAQVVIWRSPAAGLSHFAIFWGFIVLFIGTCIVAVEEYGTWMLGVDHLIFYGPFYIGVSWALEVFGLLFLAGLGIAILRRRRDACFRPLARPIDGAVIWLFLVIGVSGFLVEGLRIAGASGGMAANEFERWSFVGWGLAHLFEPMGDTAIRGLHLTLWVGHMALSMAFIAVIPYCKLRHIFFAPLNVALAEPRRPGRYAGVSMEEVEETGVYGVGEIEHFSWRQLVSFDACTECARCQTSCPAYATGKPLSPMQVVLDVARLAGSKDGKALHGETISADVLWSCTSCGACVEECPVSIDQLGAIVDMRRSLVGEGEIRGSEQGALRSIVASGNPWGLPQEERTDWSEGLEVPTVDEVERPDVLFWVGCAGCYDRRSQKVSRALVEILSAAGLSFATLGKKERCTGDPARRMGDEFTYSEMATANVETLNALSFKRIVTACPHCFNTIRNEYPELGGEYEVVHHTQLIDELITSGRIEISAAAASRVAFHDPCYLGRQNGEFDAPRSSLAATGADLREAPESRQSSFCCGAGGGRMWMEESIGERVNAARWSQLEVLQPDVVAVSCPFCMTMMTDAATATESATRVEDVAEIVAGSLPRAGSEAEPDSHSRS